MQNVVTADVPLAVGEVNQQVSVTSKVPLLQAQDASLGQTIPSSQVNDLPLNGRNWLSLTQLAAGTSATSGSSPDNPEQLQDNGVSQTQVDYRLNGIDNNIDIFEAALARAGSVAPVRTLCRRPTCTTANFTNLQDLITGNSGTATDGLGRTFSNGTILDPETTRSVAAHAIDPITGLTNTSGSAIYVRDPFYSGSLVGMTDFSGSTSQLNMVPASRLDPNSVKLLQLLPNPTRSTVAPTSNNYFVAIPYPTYTNPFVTDAIFYKGDNIGDGEPVKVTHLAWVVGTTMAVPIWMCS